MLSLVEAFIGFFSGIGEPEQEYLIRVFVDVDCDPAEVVTVYRTTKIEKYWRATP
jgi:hypothetical protein